MDKASDHFTVAEVSCSCGCGARLSEEFLELLEDVRTTLGLPMTVNSAARCPQHNMEVGGKPASAHTHNCAVDIKCPDGEYYYRLLEAAIECGVPRIGLAKTFLHLDNDPTLPTPRVWFY